MHRRSLERFDFDSVLLPYNYPLMQNAKYAADFERLAQMCQERNVAMQTIKGITLGPWATTEKTYATWYQPLEEQSDIDTAVQWVIGRVGLFLNTAGDIHLLPKILDAANRFQARPSEEEIARVMDERKMTPLFAG
jgi:hypothetical protein